MLAERAFDVLLLCKQRFPEDTPAARSAGTPYLGIRIFRKRSRPNCMKITGINVLGPKHGYLSFVEIHTDEGLTGIGATDAPWCIVSALVEHGSISLRSLLIGENPCEPRRLWKKMFEKWQARRGRGAEGGLAVNAMAALDMALWDLAGKAQGKTVCELLGGAVQPQVMAYASASLFEVLTDGSWKKKTSEELVRECRAFVGQGFKAIKSGWGNCFAPEDDDNLAAMREAIGPSIRLMVDFGCPAYWTEGWNAASAIRAARMLEKHGVYFLEEAMRPDDVEGFSELSKAVDVKIATGESLTTVYQFDPFIERRALDIVQPDAQQIGITQFDEVQRKAGAAGMLCVPHGPWTAMTVASHLHLLASAPNGDMVEYPGMTSFEYDPKLHREVSLNNFKIVEYPPQLKDGYLQLSSRPGLGVGNLVHEAIRELDEIYPRT